MSAWRIRSIHTHWNQLTVSLHLCAWKQHVKTSIHTVALYMGSPSSCVLVDFWSWLVFWVRPSTRWMNSYFPVLNLISMILKGHFRDQAFLSTSLIYFLQKIVKTLCLTLRPFFILWQENLLTDRANRQCNTFFLPLGTDAWS